MKFSIFLIFAVWAVCGYAENASYEGYTVFRMYPKNDYEMEALLDLQKNPNLDFWTYVNGNGLPVDVMVEPSLQAEFLQITNLAGLNPTVYIENVQSLIDQQKIGRYTPGRAMTWTQYYKLGDIELWLKELENTYKEVTTIVGGRSYEGRNINGVKISFRSGRQSIILEGGIHAREWISPATMTYIINELLTSKDPIVRRIAESFDWYIFPTVNPDGYTVTHTSVLNRMWRKTVTPYGLCKGADPNRNWDAHWLEQGASTNPCIETYAGPRAFSEIETSTFSKFISSVSSNLVVYFAFHSYGQMLLLPYGHTTAHLDNYYEMMLIGRAGMDALAQKYGTKYKLGNIAETICNLASGGSIDWVKQEFKTPIVAAYELRDTGRYGFLLPPNQIIANSQEVVDSIVAMMLEGAKMGYVNLI